MNKGDSNKLVTKSLSVLGRVRELVSTFWKVKSISFSRKNSKFYFGNAKLEDWISLSKPQKSSITPQITWVGQSTFLIQIDGINILTDPIFNDLMFLYKRNAVPGIDIADLPPIDLVLISHNHPDHMNLESLRKIKKNHTPQFWVSRGNKSFLDREGFSSVSEMDWWENKVLNFSGKEVKISFLPAKHWSGRGILDINKTLWGSFMIEIMGVKFYFAGDSSYADHFKMIANKFPSIDVAFLPIGPKGTKEVAKYSHLHSGSAVDAFLDLNAKHFIPMHWGTFRLGLDKFDEPVKDLQNAWDSRCNFLKNKKLHLLKFGERLEIGI